MPLTISVLNQIRVKFKARAFDLRGADSYRLLSRKPGMSKHCADVRITGDKPSIESAWHQHSAHGG